MGRRLSGNGGGGALRAATKSILVASAAGVVTTIRTGLKAPVTFGNKTGNANLSVPNASGQVSATAAIAAGASQAIAFVATGADGCTQPWALTLTGSYVIAAITANVATSIAAGATIANITGVPTGQTPVLSPADGRFAIAGDEATGWKLVRGLSAISDGTFTGSISAPGAIAGAVTLTIATEAPYSFTHAEASDLVARMTGVSDARKAVIDTTIGMLKVNASGTNLLTALDILRVGAAHNEAASHLNWISNFANSVVEGAPPYRVDRGHTLVDSTVHKISFGVGANALTQYQRDNASMHFWGRNHTNNQSLSTIGNISVSGGEMQLTPRNSSGLMASRINSGSATSGAANTTSWGLNSVCRTSSTAVQHYKNGVASGGVGSATSEAKSSALLKLGGNNQAIVAAFGRATTAAETLALHAAVAYYLNAVGCTELVATTPTWSREATVLLPDGDAPYIVGKGLNGLGFARDPVDGSIWFARGTGAASLTQAGIAHMSADGDGMPLALLDDWTLTEINATDTGGTITDLVAGSCQGITIDTSNQTIYFINKIANQLVWMSKAGVLLGVYTIGSTANGLAYDAGRDCLIIGYTSANIIWVSKTGVALTGSAAKSIQFTSTQYGDQIYYDPATKRLYMSTDGGFTADSKCQVWPIEDPEYPLPYLATNATMEGSRQAEGIYVYNGKAYGCFDESYHGGGSNSNTGGDSRNANNVRRFTIS